MEDDEYDEHDEYKYVCSTVRCDARKASKISKS